MGHQDCCSPTLEVGAEGQVAEAGGGGKEGSASPPEEAARQDRTVFS